MAHPYEVVYIFDPALDEETIKQKLSHFQTLVQVPGNEPQFNHWGKRTLAYPIRRNDTGYYVVANFDAEPAALPEFERAIKLDEGVIRHLVVLNDEPPTPAQAAPAKTDYEEEE
ncbi:MAG TPA: 30S ribosomal protein S6 [Gemmatimonadales bacterium]|jgi:small subunit ribosomal protein S6|nr:30S ribosomal protein S6 [Gemmatimonadales bacterium]